MKRKVFSFILGAVIFGSISSVLAFSYFAYDSEYNTPDSSWDVSDVAGALDYLHVLSKDPLYKLSPDYVQGTYKQAHGSSSNNLSINTAKGKYLVLLIYSYAGATTSRNVASTRSSNVSLTPTNGTCTILDSKGYTSGGATIYSGSQYFDHTLDFIFYRCEFTSSGTLVSTTRGTNSYDPDSYVLRYIKFE